MGESGPVAAGVCRARGSGTGFEAGAQRFEVGEELAEVGAGEGRGREDLVVERRGGPCGEFPPGLGEVDESGPAVVGVAAAADESGLREPEIFDIGRVPARVKERRVRTSYREKVSAKGLSAESTMARKS